MAFVFRTAAAILATLVVTAPATAGMVCRGSVITGFEREAQTAAAVLGAPTHDPAALRVYAARNAAGYYYESNFVRPGQQAPTKIVSATPLTPRQIVVNVMYVSLAEVAANTDATEVALAAIDRGTTQLASID